MKEFTIFVNVVMCAFADWSLYKNGSLNVFHLDLFGKMKRCSQLRVAFFILFIDAGGVSRHEIVGALLLLLVLLGEHADILPDFESNALH